MNDIMRAAVGTLAALIVTFAVAKIMRIADLEVSSGLSAAAIVWGSTFVGFYISLRTLKS